MGQTTGQIEADIQNKRDDLHFNLRELESKVKSVTDWKQHYRKRPGTMVAVAAGVGVLASAMVGRQRRRRRSGASSEFENGTEFSGWKHPALETWDSVKKALVGVATGHVTGFLGKAVPGFQDQLDKIQGNKVRYPAHKTQA